MSICSRCYEHLDENGNHLNGLNVCDDILYSLKKKGLAIDE
ncbi:MAG: hypothetical protein KatS3mg003_1003 [Candidatus Nitrosocaldaceae archaeon]|nr:MAG: hypothetical protein KatS3mg003_1003 [Candidatus Nitrosocaldaceae archaeon]